MDKHQRNWLPWLIVAFGALMLACQMVNLLNARIWSERQPEMTALLAGGTAHALVNCLLSILLPLTGVLALPVSVTKSLRYLLFYRAWGRAGCAAFLFFNIAAIVAAVAVLLVATRKRPVRSTRR